MQINISGLEDFPFISLPKCTKDMETLLFGANLNGKIINITFIDEEQMLSLQQSFLNKNYVTDVLSFPMPKNEQLFSHTKNILGDIVICAPQALKQALELDHTIYEEIIVLLAHGLYHLLGYDHERSEKEAQEQMQLEMELLKKTGFNHELSLLKRSV